jgi:hypothetical protein
MIYMYFCAYLEHNLLKIYWRKARFKKMLLRNMKHISCSVHFFNVLQFLKQLNKLDAMCTFPNFYIQQSPWSPQAHPKFELSKNCNYSCVIFPFISTDYWEYTVLYDNHI